MPQTKTEIKAILDQAGLRANRRLGQHFLIDGNLMNKFVEAAEIAPQDVVLEVGAGTGSLTELLLERAASVVAVEIDRGLFKALADRLGERSNLVLAHADILERKSKVSDTVLRALRDQLKSESSSAALVANLPYQVVTPLLVDLLTCGVPFSRFCFSVQQEVAERIIAEHGSKIYGPLSVVLQSCCSIEKLFSLPPQVFWPRPAVDSVVMRLDVDMCNFETPAALEHFIRFVRQGFGHRRKTLHYNLKSAYDEQTLQEASAQLSIDLRWRAEQLPVIKWLELSEVLGRGR